MFSLLKGGFKHHFMCLWKGCLWVMLGMLVTLTVGALNVDNSRCQCPGSELLFAGQSLVMHKLPFFPTAYQTALPSLLRRGLSFGHSPDTRCCTGCPLISPQQLAGGPTTTHGGSPIIVGKESSHFFRPELNMEKWKRVWREHGPYSLWEQAPWSCKQEIAGRFFGWTLNVKLPLFSPPQKK